MAPLGSCGYAIGGVWLRHWGRMVAPLKERGYDFKGKKVSGDPRGRLETELRAWKCRLSRRLWYPAEQESSDISDL